MAARDPDSWMWERARELLEQADRLHRELFRLGAPTADRPTWEPPVDVFETSAELWIVVALPGVDADTIEIALEPGAVLVAGETALPPGLSNATVHRLEVPRGRYERRVELPVPCSRLRSRELSNGCLYLGLEKG